ncbi:dehydrogenase E1 component-domain-containing protein, partial [Coprinopsis sp. MPI-PUGE-AT-0042]
MGHGIKPDDCVITSYRRYPGGPRRAPPSSSRHVPRNGRVQHVFTPSFFDGNGIVGAQVLVGAGAAFAKMYKGEKTCTFAMYGDGASLNLPCIFVRVNNKYGMGTPAERGSSNTSYYMRGGKIPGLQVNGMDIIAAKQAVQYARNWAVDQGNGPLLLEFVTYHYGGHSMSDPGTTYRTREEVRRMRSTQDPIRGLQKYLEEWGVASEQELKAIDMEAKNVLDAAVEKAKSSPEPAVKELWSDIYYKGTEPEMMRGREREE